MAVIISASATSCGGESIALFSKDGKTLASIDVPKAPVTVPVLGDFDSDGVTDIILVTEDAILGYRRSNHVYSGSSLCHSHSLLSQP